MRGTAKNMLPRFSKEFFITTISINIVLLSISELDARGWGCQRCQYTPCGPIMCEEICRCNLAASQYTVEDLLCRCSYGPSSLSVSIKERWSCLKKRKQPKLSQDDLHFIQKGSLTYSKNGTRKSNFLHLLDCKPAIISACTVSDLNRIKQLIQPGVDCHTKTKTTPLLLTAKSGNKTVFGFMLKKGFDLCRESRHAENLLHHAIMSRNPDVVKEVLLLDLFDINKKTSYGVSPLMLATRYGNIDVFDILVRYGANLKTTDNSQRNILHEASHISHNVAIIEHILKLDIAGLDIESKDGNGHTPYMWAARMCCMDNVHFLKSQGCNLQVKSRSKSFQRYIRICLSKNS